jgi:hypothetical protein
VISPPIGFLANSGVSGDHEAGVRPMEPLEGPALQGDDITVNGKAPSGVIGQRQRRQPHLPP